MELKLNNLLNCNPWLTRRGVTLKKRRLCGGPNQVHQGKGIK